MTYNREGNGAAEGSLPNYKRLRLGDIAFEGHTSKEFAYGRFVLNDAGQGIMSPRFSCLRPIVEQEFKFWKYYIHNERVMRKKLVNSTKSGTMMNELVVEDFLDEMILVPPLAEQRAIGSLLQNLDSLITLHQRKSNLTAKTLVLAWEQRKLGELGTTYGGLSGKTKNDFGHGEARFVPYTNVFENPIGDPKRLELVEIDPSQNVVRRGDALFTVSSETPEEVGMSCIWPSDLENLYLNSFCFGYRQNGTFDQNYLAFMLRSDAFRNQVETLAQGISRFNISKHKVMEIGVPVPEREEQMLVGRYFAYLENLITLHQ